ncbi:MAG: hypothetical protein JXK16_12020 [Thiotrichales bacterium]|nr:hypothetical protein [Thiotrichales bacterium]
MIKKTRIQTTGLLLFGLALAGLSLFAQASTTENSGFTTKLTTGFFYSSGQSDTINSSDATTSSIPLMLSFKKDRLSMGVSTAYLMVDSDSFNAEGMGDTTFSIGYDITESPWFTVKLKEKFATGDETEGLSTGKNDTSLQLDYFYPIKTNTSVFASIGHKLVGKVSGADMQNTTFASVGMGYLYPNKTNIGVSLDYRQSIYKSLDDQTGASLFVSKPLNKTYSLSAFGGYDSSETTTAGITLTTKF